MFIELVYLMILLMTCDALAEIGSMKYLNMYLFFASILGTMGKDNPNFYPCTDMDKLVGKIFSCG